MIEKLVLSRPWRLGYVWLGLEPDPEVLTNRFPQFLSIVPCADSLAFSPLSDCLRISSITVFRSVGTLPAHKKSKHPLPGV